MKSQVLIETILFSLRGKQLRGRCDWGAWERKWRRTFPFFKTLKPERMKLFRRIFRTGKRKLFFLSKNIIRLQNSLPWGMMLTIKLDSFKGGLDKSMESYQELSALRASHGSGLGALCIWTWIAGERWMGVRDVSTTCVQAPQRHLVGCFEK